MAAEALEGERMRARFHPVIDGLFLESMPIDAVRGGLSKTVPTLIGTTAEEFKLFGALSPPGTPEPTDDLIEVTAAALISESRDLDRGRALLDAYRDARAARGEAIELKELLLAAQTDQMFRVPADRFAEAQAALNPQTYMYRFDRPSPAAGGALGACHALEMPYVFGTQQVAKPFVGEGPEVDAPASRVGDAWVAFARSGDPKSTRFPRGHHSRARAGRR